MSAVISWYLIVTVLGWLAWPLAFRLLPGLPDRGYTASRALGLLLVGYVFWLLCSLGLLNNTVGGMLFSALVVLGFSLWAYSTRPDRDESLHGWLTSHGQLVAATEVLFALAFAGWAVVRAYNPEISGTEKPMELAFLNGIRGSQTFPPRDPWLSGYAISYYYFGYVIVAMLADLSGAISSVTFNLAIAMLFALTLLGAYGLIYNLVTVHRREEGDEDAAGDQQPQGAALSALLGPLLVGVMGNLEGFFELLRALHLRFIGPGFWRWLDIEDISQPLLEPKWPPGQWRFWWWWRASRVIHDRDVVGTSIGLQPIAEFPFFSFLLGDMHPHVLALPFVLLALGLAFNLLAQREKLAREQFALYTLCFGGLAFLNTWDLPFYLFILIAVMIARRVRERGAFDAADLRAPLLSGLAMLVLGVLAYLPWYIGFTSQAGGILPNVIFATRLHQYLVMFGPFIVVIVWFLADQVIRNRPRLDWPGSAALGVGIPVLLIALSLGLGTIALRREAAARNFLLDSTGFAVAGLSEEAIVAQVPAAVQAVIRHRLAHPLTPLLLTAILIVTLARLLARPVEDDQSPSGAPATPQPPFGASTAFALVLILTGTLLTLGPEFVYLRDNFGQRLNTIFKFYYAAWVMFGLATAYAAHVLVARRGVAARSAFAATLALLVLAGMVYPALATPNKAGYFTRTATEPPPTLDGIDYIRRQYPGDYNGILWLQQNAEPGAVVLEAVKDAYSYYARVSSATGLPTVIGWANHERQWRGEHYAEMAGTRVQDVREIYNTQNILRAQELADRYGVTYIFVGTLERDPDYASPGGIMKFDRYLTAVYQDAGVTIYRIDQPLVKEAP